MQTLLLFVLVGCHSTSVPEVHDPYAPTVDGAVASVHNPDHALDVTVTASGWAFEGRGLRLAAVGDVPVQFSEPRRSGPRQLSLAAPGVTERVDNGPDGIEQSWLITTPGNPLTLDLAVDGPTRAAGADGLWLLGERLLRYDDLASFDANGVELPSHFEGTRIVVDTTGAAWPVTVDPLLSDATTLQAPAGSSRFATDVFTIGDWNNDGHPDVIATDPYGGQISIFDGGPTGLSTTPSHILGPKLYRYGDGAHAGDFNGDGILDLAVGAPTFATDFGQVYVYYGKPGFTEPADLQIQGTSGQKLGLSIAVGDFDDDGLDDLAHGSAALGEVRIHRGRSTGLVTAPDTTLSSAVSGYGSVLVTGRTNNDDYDDLLVHPYAQNATTSNVLYVGSATGIDPNPVLEHSALMRRGGKADLADVNGDGYDDVIVADAGAYYPTQASGLVEIFLSSATGPDATVDIQLGGPHLLLYYFGTAVRGVGDVNDDGYEDLLVGSAYNYDDSDLMLYLGAPGGPTDGVYTAFRPTNLRTYTGVGPAGDQDGDGLDDLVVSTDGVAPYGGWVYYSINDKDDDGYAEGIDCNDSNASVFPGAAELCNGFDDNCDGQVDTGTYYADTDNDGWGDDSTMASGCAPGPGYTAQTGDCNDADATVFPGADELCDSIDNDCDNTADEDPIDGTTFYVDGDGDGFGSTTSIQACTLPAGHSAVDTDCNDADNTVFPAASETCNVVDDDCDGTVDEDPVGAPTWYLDSDGDGAGSSISGTAQACNPPTGHTAADDDCDDTDATIHPAALEACNGYDDNCNGVVDLDAVGAQWFGDGDNDGYGDPSVTVNSCTAPSGFVNDNTDCAPANAAINPGAIEIVGDEIDQNCDTDELCYTDVDADGYRSASIVVSDDLFCSGAGEAPAGMPPGDCNDANNAVNPGATEVCANGLDDDCNGVTDTDATGATSYLDSDGDGYGDANVTSNACPIPTNHVLVAGDCDDADSTAFPGATEQCDGVDDDCDGDTDEGAPGAPAWYADGDGDGWGGEVRVFACSAPLGFVAVPGDCNDVDPAIHPNATEVVSDEEDQDCDGIELCYEDIDGDGWRSMTITPSSGRLCTDPGLTSLGRSRAWDCNDGAFNVNPDQTEACNGFDDNCDGIVDTDATVGTATWFADADGDTYGDVAVWVVQCDPPVGFVNNKDDCDPTDGNVHPTAVEVVGDQIDQNCDGNEICYTDLDGDGYRANIQITSIGNADCTETGEATASYPDGDCEDGTPSANPGAAEVCGNNIDDDCDGTVDTDAVVVTTYLDADGDGWGDASVPNTVCPTPAGYVSLAGDCDDSSATTYPGADELCDSVDNDCDSLVDDNPVDADTWYADADGDGFGNTAAATVECTAPVGFVTTGGDCNDNQATAYPGSSEVIGDEIDQDCNGVETCYRDIDGDGYRTASAVDSVDTTCSAPGLATVTNTQPGDCNDASAAIHPGATELCNAIDDDCSGTADDGISQDFWRDADSDGYGDPNELQTGCPPAAGYVANADDCDDGTATVHPGADETCNNIDDDCDTVVDETPVDVITWYLDADSDGVGGATATTGCTAPSGFVATTGDCNDLNAAVAPGGTEIPADGLDGDCDGFEDCYIDADQDGYRLDALVPTADVTCSAPYTTGNVPTGDCDDADAARNPGVAELCNSIDDDCNGSTDDNTPLSYADTDGDRYGDPNVASGACPSPSGYVGNAGDCDDTDSAISPDATETCNGVDDDCDGVVDTGGSGLTTWYFDNDGDGYGGSVSVDSCAAPSGYVAADGDCADDDANVRPGATEQPGDGVDQNCDALEECYQDSDGDGYRTDITVLSTDVACDDPGKAPAVAPSNDCNDNDASVHPGAPEANNGIDDNCNGNVDEAASRTDDDGDGFCDSLQSCVDGSLPGDCNDDDPAISPDSCEVDDDLDNDCSGEADDASRNRDCDDQDGDGYAFEDGDCNDYNDRIHPGANERCNGLDDDCDGYVGHEELDLDQDGVPVCDGDCDDFDPRASPNRAENCGDGIDNNCDGVADNDADRDGDGYTTCRGDCDDNDPLVNPAADELNNDIDDDCDLKIDEGFDLDNDGVDVCAPGEDPTSGCDCDDTDATIRPGIAEKCNNGIDDNCDGRNDDDTRDLDDDGAGACDGDCNDNDPFVGAHLPEVCDAIDNDCDGFVDEGYDKDVDGWRLCAGDCDDYVVETNAAAKELCDTLDNNCDGDIDDQWDDVDDDGFTECQGDCDDDDPDIAPDMAEVCGDGFDNDCNGTLDWKDEACNAEKLPSRWYCDTGGGSGMWLLALAVLWRRRPI